MAKTPRLIEEQHSSEQSQNTGVKKSLLRYCTDRHPVTSGEGRCAAAWPSSAAVALSRSRRYGASASGTFDAFSDARLRSRPDVGGGGVGFAFWERQRKAFLRLQLRKEGVCRAFLSVLREASTACETSFLEEILGEKEARKLSAEMSSYVNDLWPGSPRKARSRSRGRSYYRRAYAIARSRRYYGFGRTFYSEERRSWRGRSRTRSRSPSPFRLSEKDRMELLEIAKANAAKTLGTANFDLPASLRTVSVSKETNRGTAVLNNRAKSENSVAKPMLQKSAKATAEETSSGSPKIDKKKSPYGLWIPV
ncbi:hypothetical protein CB1_001244037 [Camelus ferus]|nr:hypothetical protein CB1_001244037 [Camelus ferus]